MAAAAVADAAGPVHGRPAEEIVEALGARRGPERLLNLMLRTGPYGAGFPPEGPAKFPSSGARPGGLSFDALLANPHGIDLGPLEPRLPEGLRPPSGLVGPAPEAPAAGVARRAAGLAAR